MNYAVAQLETRGLPVCGCGATFEPARIELAESLDVHCPADEYRAKLASVRHGQARHGIRGRRLRQAEQVAYERVEQRRRSNRLQALMPATEELPF